jgi:thioredoxin reductase
VGERYNVAVVGAGPGGYVAALRAANWARRWPWWRRTGDDAHAHPTLPEAMLAAALGFRDATIHYHTRG